MAKFRKIVSVVEADQYSPGLNIPRGACTLCAGKVHVHTIHKDVMIFLEPGDWVVMEPDGLNAYPVKPDIFKLTYERVEDAVNQGGDDENKRN